MKDSGMSRDKDVAKLVKFGAWLSLVERLVRDQEAGGSNPLAPTNFSFKINHLRGVFRGRPVGRARPLCPKL